MALPDRSNPADLKIKEVTDRINGDQIEAAGYRLGQMAIAFSQPVLPYDFQTSGRYSRRFLDRAREGWQKANNDLAAQKVRTSSHS